MREVTIFIGTNKDGVDHIENLKNQVLELFALAKEDQKNDIYYKYNAETGEFLEFMFNKFDLFPTQTEKLNIKGPILFVEKIHDENKSINSFLEDNKKRYLLEYLEQLQGSKNFEFIKEAKGKTEEVLKKYKKVLTELEEEISKFESFLEDKNYFEDKKEALMYEIKKLNFDGLMDRFMLFFKGVRGGKSKKNYQALIGTKDQICDTKVKEVVENIENTTIKNIDESPKEINNHEKNCENKTLDKQK